MNGPQKYYRNVITVEILSDREWADDEITQLDTVDWQITNGDSSGQVTWTTVNEEIPKEQMAELLYAQGSDATFLLGEEDDE
jgi:P pilus assembly chaperone PapD